MLLRYYIYILLSFSMLAVIATPCAAQTQDAPRFYPTKIGFFSATDDREILDVMSNYPSTPKAAYFWCAGFSGTHRVTTKMEWKNFMAEAREKYISMFQQGIKSHGSRVDRFLTKYSEKELLADQDLQQTARSLLSIRAQMETALATAKSGGALIYGLEVSAKKEVMEKLRSDRRGLVVMDRSAFVSSKVSGDTSILPLQYRSDYMDPIIQGLTSRELYPLMRKAIDTNETLHQIIGRD